jgi:hypothetical protein
MDKVVFENDAIRVTRVSIEPHTSYVPLQSQDAQLVVFLNHQYEMRSSVEDEHYHDRGASETAWYEATGPQEYSVRNLTDQWADRLIIEVKTDC